MKTPKQVLTEWVAAYNARDPYILAALYHEDATNIQVALGDPLQGREVMLESFISFFQAFPDNCTHIENLFEDGEWAILEWSGTGTFLGEFAGFTPTGKSFTLRGCGFFHVVNSNCADRLVQALEAVLNLRRQVHAVENFAFKVVQRHSHHLTVAINFNRTKELKTFCRR